MSTISGEAPGRGLRSGTVTLARRLSVVVFLAVLWQVLATTGVIDVRTLSSPEQVVRTFGELTADGSLPSALAASLQRVALGLVVGVGSGLALGVAAGMWKLGEELVDTPMQMARTIPFTAVAPLFIVWFGIGETSKVFLVAFGAAFPLYLNVYSGIRNVDIRLVEAARAYGIGYWRLLADVILPGALPSILVGLRYSLGLAVLALVTAEQINATSGIGYLLQNAEQFLRTGIILVCLIVYAVLGLAGDLIVRVLERALLTWRRAYVAR